MSINKPIFIIGSGRSGTTVFYNFLSTHPDVCWFSNLSDKYFKVKYIPIIHRIYDVPFIGTMAKKRIILQKKTIRPSEAPNIYHKYCEFKNLVKTTELDLTVESERKFKLMIENHLELTQKKRFLNKQTANDQRIRLLNSIFDDAFYIHIIRDGRAVSNSMLNVKWWSSTFIWWLGKTVAEANKDYRSPIELCALHWKRCVEEVLQNKYLFEDRYIKINYEDFIADVRGTMQKVLEFCELRKFNSFFEMLPVKLETKNYKWKDTLTEDQKAILESTLRPFLNQLGYE